MKLLISFKIVQFSLGYQNQKPINIMYNSIAKGKQKENGNNKQSY